MRQREGSARRRPGPGNPGRPHNDQDETTRRAPKRRGLGVALILAAAAALAIATPMAASATPSSGASPGAPPCNISGQQVTSAGHGHHLSGIIIAGGISTNTGACHKPPPEPAFNGTPPLLFNGNPPTCFFSPCENGNVMMTPSTSPLVIVPIFWDPTGSMSSAYKNIIASYLGDVAKASGHTQNVFSVLNEYHGNNGQIHYNIQLGPVITATNAMPASGCTLESADTSGIYADGSGYSSCLDDAQLQAEVDSVSAADNLPHNLSHIFVLYLPKHVESCFLPGQTTAIDGGQFCTINHQPTAAFCAYHSEDPASAVYANMPYPIYASPVGFTCGTDARFPTIESPNGNPDADTEISPTSHEVSEAITDPDTETGWYDSTGNEIGDDCAYIFGRTRGARGAFFNQVINGGHFITQEEFSNNLFASSGGTAGCLQSE
jgi:hypothetical protein